MTKGLVTMIGPVFATGPDFNAPINATQRFLVTTPNVSVTSGVVTVIPSATSPAGAAPATSYNVGLRLTTATGSVAGTYPIQGTIPATASPLAISLATLAVTTGGVYAASAQAVTAIGTTAWGPEFTFNAQVLPNPPGVSVA